MKFWPWKNKELAVRETLPTFSVTDVLQAAGAVSSGHSGTGWTGSKFPGGLQAGFGLDDDFEIIDLETIIRRSRQLFQRNPFAVGLIRRLVTNVINTGLKPQVLPDPELTGMTKDDSFDWSDNTEKRFSLFANDADQVDWAGEKPFSEIEAEIYRRALIDGDVLVVARLSPAGTPSYQIIPGTQLRSVIAAGRDIEHGVEIDRKGRHVAYHVEDKKTGEVVRIPARGARSGRRVARLIYGTEQRVADRRGMPLLAVVLQSLKEIDRYRDAEQRAAVINSMVSLIVTKDAPGLSADPLGAGAVRRGSITGVPDSGGVQTIEAAEYLPGMMVSNLAPGEDVESFSTSRPNVNYANFETAVLSAIAWSAEIPPEILVLQFSHNYSASKAATSEFKLFLDRVRGYMSGQFHKWVYSDWLAGEVLAGRISAPGFLESMFDRSRRVEFRAWLISDWVGAIKPSLDPVKDVKSYSDQVNAGFITRTRAAAELNGTNYRRNVLELKRENEQLAEATEPIGGIQNGNSNQDRPNPDMDKDS